ncbi:MAG: DUF4856 domain-containing protein [Flavobacteriia bacterium]|nr:DUF4856 domain-containing protein [Flavobacteriia bacterium]
MKARIFLFTILLSLGTFQLSCKKKGCTDSTATNYDKNAKKNDGSCVYEKDDSYTVPSTYVFTDANGNNTVDFSGQTIRLEMLSELSTYMKTSNTAGTSVSSLLLKSMYANSSYTWSDVLGLGMTGSSKQLKDKTANGDIGVQALFESYMDSLAFLSSNTVTGVESGTPGIAGVYPNDGVKGPYLMSAKGFEYTQLIEKGLMCAVSMYQMTENYLGEVTSDDNTTQVDPTNGKYYTEMEHHWDEAYGYFTSAVDYPTSGIDRFWGKYAKDREVLLGSSTKIINAFRKGRAAISNKDYTTRDEQINIIRNEMEKVCAGTAIHYLNEAKAIISKNTARNHSLSEAISFLSGLKYGYNAIHSVGMTNAQIDLALSYIGTNFNTVTISNLQSAIDEIALRTGLTAYKTEL